MSRSASSPLLYASARQHFVEAAHGLGDVVVREEWIDVEMDGATEQVEGARTHVRGVVHRLAPAPGSTLRRPGSLREDRRPVGVDVVVDAVWVVERAGADLLGLEGRDRALGQLDGRHEEDERDPGVPRRIGQGTELSTGPCQGISHALLERALAGPHRLQQPVEPAQLHQRHRA